MAFYHLVYQSSHISKAEEQWMIVDSKKTKAYRELTSTLESDDHQDTLSNGLGRGEVTAISYENVQYYSF